MRITNFSGWSIKLFGINQIIENIVYPSNEGSRAQFDLWDATAVSVATELGIQSVTNFFAAFNAQVGCNLVVSDLAYGNVPQNNFSAAMDIEFSLTFTKECLAKINIWISTNEAENSLVLDSFQSTQGFTSFFPKTLAELKETLTKPQTDVAEYSHPLIIALLTFLAIERLKHFIENFGEVTIETVIDNLGENYDDGLSFDEEQAQDMFNQILGLDN